MQTDHFVQAFRRQGRRLVAMPAQPCKSAEQALLRAEKLADRSAGAVAFSISGEPEFGEFDPPVVMVTYGEVPEEFAG